MYAAIKHLHLLCVTLSGAGFFLRGVLQFADSPVLNSRWIIIALHIKRHSPTDSGKLAGAAEWQYPFVDAWVTAKVFGLIAYIILAQSLEAGAGDVLAHRRMACRISCSPTLLSWR